MPYFDAVVANAVASFPNVWERATILPGDINARARFDAIRPSIPPEIGPKVSRIARPVSFTDLNRERPMATSLPQSMDQRMMTAGGLARNVQCPNTAAFLQISTMFQR